MDADPVAMAGAVALREVQAAWHLTWPWVAGQAAVVAGLAAARDRSAKWIAAAWEAL